MPPIVIAFYQGLVGTIVMLTWIVIERVNSDSGLRMASYTGKQFLLMILSSLFNAIAVISDIIAF